MKKEIKLELIKNDSGITASDHTEQTIDMFADDEEGRQAFVYYILDHFINKEVVNGKKYK